MVLLLLRLVVISMRWWCSVWKLLLWFGVVKICVRVLLNSLLDSRLVGSMCFSCLMVLSLEWFFSSILWVVLVSSCGIRCRCWLNFC